MATSFPKTRIKVLLLENIHQRAVRMLQDEGFQVETTAGALPTEELIERMKDVRVVGLRSKTKLTKEVLEAAPKLLCAGCFCIGTDQVDLDYAESKGIPVFNSPFSNSRSVAELIVSCVIALARQLPSKIQEMHAGKWMKTAKGCMEVRGKTLGIVGYGHIGSQLSVLAEALGMRVIYKDRKMVLPLGNAHQCETLEELMQTADFVTLHVPDTPETRGMITAKEIAYMRKGTYLLNASRGKVVDLEALAEALKSGHLAGAMIDVYPKEPAKNGDMKEQGVEIPLVGLPNVILTPHIGGSTEEAQEAIGVEVAQKLISFVNKGSTEGAVNFPNVVPPVDDCPNTHRILNVHKNKPGVLRDLNNILWEAGNIKHQSLSTTDQVGYLVADIGHEVSQEIFQRINALESNVRTRILY